MLRPVLPALAVLLASSRARVPDAPAAPPAPPASPAASALVSDPAEYAIEHVSEDAGERIFTRTGVGDPYRTGLPYPVFLALLAAYPDELGGTTAAFAARFGFLPRRAAGEDRDDREGLPIGMHLTTDPNTRIPFLMTSCALCHAEVIRWPGGEKLVVGIGNKRIRIHAYDDALARIAARADFDAARLGPLAAKAAEERALAWPSEARAPMLDATIHALRDRAAARGRFLDRVRGGLPGRVAPIESF